MREIRARGALAVVPREGVCSVDGCSRVTDGGDEVCPRCQEEIEALEEMARADKRSEYAVKAPGYATRLRNFAWFVFLLAMMSALGYYIWPCVWATFELWFGTGN